MYIRTKCNYTFTSDISVYKKLHKNVYNVYLSIWPLYYTLSLSGVVCCSWLVCSYQSGRHATESMQGGGDTGCMEGVCCQETTHSSQTGHHYPPGTLAGKVRQKTVGTACIHVCV